ncbi:MAG: S8 family serine peptidase [Chloroflexota bacterium]
MLCALIASALVGSAAAAAPGRAAGGPVARYIVTLDAPAGVSRAEARRMGPAAERALVAERAASVLARTDALAAGVGFRPMQRYAWATAGFTARLDARQAAVLARTPGVRSVVPDRPVRLTAQVTPDPVRRVGAVVDGPAPSIDVNVAIVDTGISTWEPGDGWVHDGELRIAGGVNATGGGGSCATRTSAPAAYADTNGHGTHVAGIVGAMDNTIGAVGVAPGARLWSVRVFSGTSGSTSSVICGLDWIAHHNATAATEDRIAVVNMSLAGMAWTPERGCANPAVAGMERAVCTVAQTALVVVAAGNSSEDASGIEPALYSVAFTVSAMADYDGLPGGLAQPTCSVAGRTSPDDAWAHFSNFGPAVDITAPGVCVPSTDMSTKGGLVTMSGTSMATPVVAGAAARYLAEHPGTTPAELRTRLVESAGFDWDAATDPDADPDRLVDVAALLATTPGFTLSATPPVAAVRPGAALPIDVAISRRGGYAGTIGLGTEPLPAGITGASWSGGGSVGAAGIAALLTVSAGPSAPDGTRTVTLTGNGTGGAEATTTIDVVVDGTAPAAGDPWPEAAFAAGTWSKSAAVRLAYATEDAGSGVRGVTVQRLTGSGWTAMAGSSATRTSARRTRRPSPGRPAGASSPPRPRAGAGSSRRAAQGGGSASPPPAGASRSWRRPALPPVGSASASTAPWWRRWTSAPSRLRAGGSRGAAGR